MAQFWKPGTERPPLLDDEEGGILFYSASRSSSSGYNHVSIEKQRQRLPVFRYRTSILYLVETHATTIIVGETGSGKTTQIPQRTPTQYLKEAGWADGGRVIACTQPRRLAVQAVASRVAEEMGVKLGEEVGYTIRFEDLTNRDLTRIKFLTDGVLLREMMEDPLLTKYSVIMVDEAHERSMSTDILLGLLKKIQRRRPELRLIISSATIEAKSMAAFFHNSKKRRGLEGEERGPKTEPAILSVEGRGFNVQVFYAEEPVPDYIQAIVSTVMSIHDQEPMGDILVFLTGQDDIDTAVQLLTEEAQNNGKPSSEPHCVLSLMTRACLEIRLWSQMQVGSKMFDKLFDTCWRCLGDWLFCLYIQVSHVQTRGKRKVVISTNIAETSLTLEGVVYVVDSGFSKQRFYNPVASRLWMLIVATFGLVWVQPGISDIENLVVAPISKASARQRAGRAGRVRPGKCYRLYTEEHFVKEMSAEGIPEMQRSNLVSCVIQLKALGIDNILGFDWPASPSPEAMIRALEVLYSLGVLDDDAKLTSPTGFQIAEIPLDPMISKMILASNQLGCSEEIITIAAVLSIQSIWISARGQQKQLDEAKLRFAAAEGDHVTFLNVYKGFLQSGKSSKWCNKNFVNYHAMRKVIEIREQLRRIALRIGMVLKSCESDMQKVLNPIFSHTAPFGWSDLMRNDKNDEKQNSFSCLVYKIGGKKGSYCWIFCERLPFRSEHSATVVCTRLSEVLKKFIFTPHLCYSVVNPKWVIYHSIVSTDRQYMRNVISLDPSWLLEAAPHFYQHQQPNSIPH
ncbi:unnamed protein product [Camellia sinensis]